MAHGGDAEVTNDVTVRVAGWQMPVTNDVDQNSANVLRGLDLAAKAGADFLLTPEGALSGYHSAFDGPKTERALDRISADIARTGVALALGTCRTIDGKSYNQLLFYDKNGALCWTHSKILLAGPRRLPLADEFVETAVFDSRPLQAGCVEGVKLGGLICNDLWSNPVCTSDPDPDLLGSLAAEGVRLVFHASNTGYGSEDDNQVHRDFHTSNLRLHTRAVGIPLVSVDGCDPTRRHLSNAPSGVLDTDGRWMVGPFFDGPHLFTAAVRTAGTSDCPSTQRPRTTDTGAEKP